jgi:hypothetical protein
MKFLEFFERSSLTVKSIRCLLLTGSDSTLKNLTAQTYSQIINCSQATEPLKLSDLQDMLALWGEGSFFGPRFFAVTLAAKTKNLGCWKQLAGRVKHSDHFMLIDFESDNPNLVDLNHSPSFITVVECKFPRTTKEKARLVDFRARQRGYVLDPDIAKEIATRIKTANEMESVTLTLGLIFKIRKRIVMRDIDYLLNMDRPASINSHALLTGNLRELYRDIDSLEPMFIVTGWFNVLRCFYSWLCQEDRKSPGIASAVDIAEDNEDGDDENSEVKLNKYQLKDYRLAQQRYSLPRTREILESFNSIYQDLRVGRSEGWRERLKMAAQKLAAKA